ncbi:hypothetical protein TREMEDRAFT_61565 [Tremella mesenterica DSM 1558]|uniref:uncharacterized protein n=1 Tax=Tremella mesenterica (strain ATCC 24925 / CBS 8224 / DSM 1558 / NBRC 9311 / NRRL Y-6157 / RJB 2259-6 / UBC 559-6) TaxID=578456 RepID=UPI0003F4A377|nr:uncharacterized protein TREMEDRAFT_61565 [Tremella mesenterica DSM 1558]EIW69797.1 hypothetical protein TREMEDRAFT_61565 [Tremella mesenterica DSM 1558]
MDDTFPVQGVCEVKEKINETCMEFDNYYMCDKAGMKRFGSKVGEDVVIDSLLGPIESHTSSLCTLGTWEQSKTPKAISHVLPSKRKGIPTELPGTCTDPFPPP